MSVYQIALGTKRNGLEGSKTKQVEWEWGELVQRLKNVTYAEHTLAQYAAMTKPQRVEAKDCGFFIGGLANGRKVVYRQIISLDIDDADENTLKQLRDWLKGRAYIIHSTHSSTPESPRYRVVAPLNRIVQSDEYGALMRILSDKFNIPIDESTFDFSRIMFLPSVPKDAEYFFESKDGRPIDVEETLAELEDWKDLSAVMPPKALKVQDPLKKGGLIGAFCAKVSITEALETYLSDKWTKGKNGRYSLIGATTFDGGIVYDNNLLFYSNHSSDPFQGRSHNAYDLVRLYKFGDDKKTGEAGMLALCEQLDIKADAGKKHNLTIEGLEDDEAKAILKETLTIDKNGNLHKSLTNAVAILEYDPDLRGVFGYDLFAEAPTIRRVPYWRTNDAPVPPQEHCQNVIDYKEMADYDESFTRGHFEQRYDFDVRTCLTDALNIVTYKNSFHPIRDYLNSLEWDGVKRLERIFIDCFGVNDTLYSREVGKKFFTGAVRRVFMPASKMDYIPVLVSEEGLGKSTFIRRMAKLWGSDTFYTFSGGKEAYEQLRGVWILEIPELDGVQKRSTNNRKAFVTKGEDRYRSAYLKYTKTYKRQCVFIASSNDVVFLDDPSEDGRRWWGLMCNPANVKIDIFSDEFRDVLVDQYWAEAVTYYLEGVLPVLSPAAEAEARVLRQIHKAESIEEGALIDYLNMPVPDDWYKRSVAERTHYWEHEKELWSGKPRNTVCTTEIAREFFGNGRGETNAHRGREIGDAIRATGLFVQDGSKQRFGEYGIAKAWVRTEVSKRINDKKK